MLHSRSTLVRATLGALLLASLMVVASPAYAQKEWLVHSFAADGSQGALPMGNLVADGAGNLYGTTFYGGTFTYGGTVYELVRPVPPKTAWTETVLYNFTGGFDGYEPSGGLVFDNAGNLYGTASQSDTLYGAVFELSPPATPGGTWTQTVLHAFNGIDGDLPFGELIRDGAGNLYGIAYFGGNFGTCKKGCGTVYRLSPPPIPGNSWVATVLHSFVYPQFGPSGGLVSDSEGNLYGSTGEGAAHGGGMVYRLTPPATVGGPWGYKVLHAFGPTNAGSAEGRFPVGPLTLHGRGVLYGTTGGGGLYNSGTVFQLVPPTVAGGAWTENVLYSFGGSNNDGQSPTYGVIFDSAGNLYGTTSSGGDASTGTVFKLSPPALSSGNWTESVLHSFGVYNGGKDAGFTSGGLVFSKNGVLFGTTGSGGTANVGEVFGLLP
jgi:uncharacterized repeat protein (TIGR03803 family)